MNVEQTKIVGLGAAVAAGALSLPLLGRIDAATQGKYLYLSGGGALALGLGLGYFGRHPAFQGLGYALAAVGGYVLMADYQAASAVQQTATAGMTGMNANGHAQMVMSPPSVVGTNGRRYNVPEAFYPSVPKSRLDPYIEWRRMQYMYD